MGETTGITWTDHTFNAWWGCHKVSAECRSCYAETLDKRVGGSHWGLTTERRFFGPKHWAEPVKWNKAAEAAGERRRVFCSSMADVFEAHPVPELNARMDAERNRLYGLIEATPWLTWLLLTKRPESLVVMLPPSWLARPRPNVWLGTTAGTRSTADERIPALLKCPAAVRFVSVEPMLEPVDLRRIKPWHPVHGPDGADALWGGSWGHDHVRRMAHDPASPGYCNHSGAPTLSWVIVGGESGHGARRMDPAWALDVKAQCAGGVAFFMKQAGVVLGKEWGCMHPHGADPAEWPEEFRVQEFPVVHA